MWCGRSLIFLSGMLMCVCILLIKEAVYVCVCSNGDQHRAVKYSSVSPSWPFRAKGAVIIRRPVISGGQLGFGECVPLLHISVLFTLQPHRPPQQKGISSAEDHTATAERWCVWVCEWFVSMKSITSGSDMHYSHISTITCVMVQLPESDLLMPLRQCQEYHKNNFKSVVLFSRLLLALARSLTWHHVRLIKLTLKRRWHHDLAVILLDVFGFLGSHGNSDVMATQACFQENHSWHVVK